MRTTRGAVQVWRVSLVVVVILGLALGATGCAFKLGARGWAPLTVTDDAGRQVTFDHRPARIVSLAPSNTEILFAVGAGSKVVGVDTYSNYPAEAKTLAKIGSLAKPNIEAIVALKPDLVLATSLHTKLLDQFEKLNLKVLVLSPRTIEEVYANLALVGQVTGTEQKAKAVVDNMKTRLAKVAEVLKTVRPEDRVAVYYEVYSDPLMSVGPGTFIHQVITLAGGRNLFADAKTDYPVVGSETVVARNPSVIVYPDFHGDQALTTDKVKARPGWDRLQAVAKGRVFGIDADIISRPGPRLADAVEAIAKILYPDKFGK